MRNLWILRYRKNKRALQVTSLQALLWCKLVVDLFTSFVASLYHFRYGRQENLRNLSSMESYFACKAVETPFRCKKTLRGNSITKKRSDYLTPPKFLIREFSARNPSPRVR